MRGAGRVSATALPVAFFDLVNLVPPPLTNCLLPGSDGSACMPYASDANRRSGHQSSTRNRNGSVTSIGLDIRLKVNARATAT